MKKDWNQLNTEEKNKTIRIIANIAFFISLLIPAYAMRNVDTGVNVNAGGLGQGSAGFILWISGFITLYFHILKNTKQAFTASFIHLIILIIFAIVRFNNGMGMSKLTGLALLFKLGSFLPLILAVIMLKPSLLQKNRTD